MKSKDKKIYSIFSLAIIFLVAFLIFGWFGVLPSAAQEKNDDYGLGTTAKEAGIPGAEEGELATSTNLAALIGSLLGSALTFVGVIFLILMIYGGINWMIARGNEQKVEKSKDTIVNAIIGVVVVALSYFIVEFVLNRLIFGGG
ncbi:MAG: hypothetical protein PHD51_04225 [Patescibacteria group bacterium]|nr:hypothetical protein [Patescibacteria group bacterium]MDD5490831.1 hypothetical protein [Patescibacteria group bacterium]